MVMTNPPDEPEADEEATPLDNVAFFSPSRRARRDAKRRELRGA